MNTNKILLGGLVGGVILFLLGWLIYGILLMDFMQTNCNQCMMRPMEEMIWGALIVSNFAWGFLLALVFNWSNTSELMAGAKVAGIIGLLTAIAFDLSMYSMSTMFNSLSAIFVDVIAFTVMLAIAGAVVAWVMGMGKK